VETEAANGSCLLRKFPHLDSMKGMYAGVCSNPLAQQPKNLKAEILHTELGKPKRLILLLISYLFVPLFMG
jgi:hypothetical protein